MTGKHVEGLSAKEGNKELYIIPGASHVDLYDDEADVVPYDKMVEFFTQYPEFYRVSRFFWCMMLVCLNKVVPLQHDVCHENKSAVVGS